jgi:hypothetical protein
LVVDVESSSAVLTSRQSFLKEVPAVDGVPRFADQIVVHLEPVRLKIALHLKFETNQFKNVFFEKFICDVIN